jgi:2-oxo-4-hydroxy-4-carboxy-5-ureidoimidazoline decarboxylase
MTIAELDRLTRAAAIEVLTSCCGARQWVERMVARRPFGSAGRVRSDAEEIWESLSREDRLEAFSHHPRIGETRSTQPVQGQAWSSREQAGVADATDPVRRELERVNQDYEARFGYRYIVSASGRSAGELLRLARERLRNEPEDEFRVAAGEQLRITLLRLDRLLSTGG